MPVDPDNGPTTPTGIHREKQTNGLVLSASCARCFPRFGLAFLEKFLPPRCRQSSIEPSFLNLPPYSLRESRIQDSPHRPPSPSTLQAAPPIRFPPAQKWFVRSEKPAALAPPSARVDRCLIEVCHARSGPGVAGLRPTVSGEARFLDKGFPRPLATLFRTRYRGQADPAWVKKKTQSAEVSTPQHHPVQTTKVNQPSPPHHQKTFNICPRNRTHSQDPQNLGDGTTEHFPPFAPTLRTNALPLQIRPRPAPQRIHLHQRRLLPAWLDLETMDFGLGGGGDLRFQLRDLRRQGGDLLFPVVDLRLPERLAEQVLFDNQREDLL